MVVVEEESDDKVFGGEWEKFEATAVSGLCTTTSSIRWWWSTWTTPGCRCLSRSTCTERPLLLVTYKDTTLRIIGVDHPRGDYRRIIRADKDYRRIIRANKDYSRIIGVSKIILGLLEDY